MSKESYTQLSYLPKDDGYDGPLGRIKHIWNGRDMSDLYKTRRKRTGAVLGLAVAATAGVGLTHEYTVGSSEVIINQSEGAPHAVADQVCAAAEELVGPDRFNKEACLDDLADFKLPDGTIVEVAYTSQPVSVANGSIEIDSRNVRTSLDGLQIKNQQ